MRLYINVDHVATVRQARGGSQPDPVDAAAACERAGADGITVHLREDRRHIQDHDVRRLAATVSTGLNLELATAVDILELAVALRPRQATLVPERREELTTEGGLHLGPRGGPPDPRLADAVARLVAVGIRTSLFIDPDPHAVELSAACGAQAIELHTGEYANAGPGDAEQLDRLREAARMGVEAGLAVHAGHGLDRQNVGPVAAIAEVEELNIGHSIVARSILVGMEAAVREMRRVVDAARVDQPHAAP